MAAAARPVPSSANCIILTWFHVTAAGVVAFFFPFHTLQGSSCPFYFSAPAVATDKGVNIHIQANALYLERNKMKFVGCYNSLCAFFFIRSTVIHLHTLTRRLLCSATQTCRLHTSVGSQSVSLYISITVSYIRRYGSIPAQHLQIELAQGFTPELPPFITPDDCTADDVIFTGCCEDSFYIFILQVSYLECQLRTKMFLNVIH